MSLGATPTRGITVAAFAWAGAAAVYLLLRLAAFASVPVGGHELWSLAGAWQAREGLEDSRFVPTLFQALAALLLRLDDSELLPRLLALAAASTVPVSLFALRRRLGEPVALLALLFLTFDPLQLAHASAAGAAALDLPLALATFAAWPQFERRRWLLAPAGFLWATAGPVGLPLALGAGVVGLLSGARPDPRLILSAGAGAAVGLAAASIGFGTGWQGVTVPPFDLFAASFEAPWSSESTRRLFALYAWGPAAAALVALTVPAALDRRRLPHTNRDRVLAAWLLAAAGWAATAGGAHDPLAPAAMTVPALLLAATGAVRLLEALDRVDWRAAGWPLAAAIAATLIALGPLLDWARLTRVGPDHEVVVVVGMSVLLAASLLVLARKPRTRAVAALPFLLVAAFPWLAGGFAVASGSPNEPLPSPVTTLQASELRDLGLGPDRDPGGLVVIHPSVADALTWPLRGVPGVVVASRIPPNAAIVVWTADASVPDGFRIAEGRWSVLRERNGPRSGFLDYLRWLANRNTLPVRDTLVTVFIREQP